MLSCRAQIDAKTSRGPCRSRPCPCCDPCPCRGPLLALPGVINVNFLSQDIHELCLSLRLLRRKLVIAAVHQVVDDLLPGALFIFKISQARPLEPALIALGAKHHELHHLAARHVYLGLSTIRTYPKVRQLCLNRRASNINIVWRMQVNPARKRILSIARKQSGCKTASLQAINHDSANKDTFI